MGQGLPGPSAGAELLSSSGAKTKSPACLPQAPPQPRLGLWTFCVWAQPQETRPCGQVCFPSLPFTPDNPPVLLGPQMSEVKAHGSGYWNNYSFFCRRHVSPVSHRFAAGMTWRPGWSPVGQGSTSSGPCWLHTASCSPAVFHKRKTSHVSQWAEFLTTRMAQRDSSLCRRKPQLKFLYSLCS